MKLWEIVKTVGAGVISEVIPGGGLILEAVNAFLPDDKKLSSTSTGADIGQAIATLPAAQRVEIMAKEFDVDITHIKESYSTVRAMLESDVINPHTTRPYIAKQSFHIIAFASIVAISIWAVGAYTSDEEIVNAITEGWPFILAVTAPFATVLYAYFGVLKAEHKQRMDAANGISTRTGLAGIISTLIKGK